MSVPPESTPLAAEILQWAEPLVRDRLDAFWMAAVTDEAASRSLSELHWRVWRAALLALPHGSAANRRDLVAMSRNAKVPAAVIQAGDEAVIEEIAEVIVARYRRAPAVAREYTKALVLTAADLINARQRAEAA